MRQRRVCAFLLGRYKGLVPPLVLAVLLLLAIAATWQGLQHVQPFSDDPPDYCSANKLSRSRLAAVSRAAAGATCWQVPFNASAHIPLQLWQTSRSKVLNSRAQQLHDTWTKLNPGLPATVMDDAEAAAFIKHSHGSKVHSLYAAFPLNIMRADFWRYAVLYVHGGIYADIDTVCLQPLQKWLPPRALTTQDPAFVSEAPGAAWQAAGQLQYSHLTWKDCSLVAALENDLHICQWIIAGVAGHPVLQAALQMSLRSVEKGIDCTYEHMVHKHTGPSVWTEAFREVLGLPQDTTAAGIARAVWTNTTFYERARQLKLCIVAPTFWGEVGNSTAQNAQNLYSSLWKSGNPNVNWVEERNKLVTAARNKTG